MQQGALVFQPVSFIHNKNAPREAVREKSKLSVLCKNSNTYLIAKQSYHKTLTIVGKANINVILLETHSR